VESKRGRIRRVKPLAIPTPDVAKKCGIADSGVTAANGITIECLITDCRVAGEHRAASRVAKQRKRSIGRVSYADGVA